MTMPRKALIQYLGYMLAGLFILCIPIFLITSNLRWAINDIHLYEYGFNKYEVSEETGFSDEELLEVAQGLIRYINTGQQGSEFEIFNDREIVHLEDVRDLVLVNYRLQEATLGFLLIFTIVGVIWQRKRFMIQKQTGRLMVSHRQQLLPVVTVKIIIVSVVVVVFALQTV